MTPKTERPLAVDLFCGLGGWTDGLLAEGWNVIGFDIERHVYGSDRYPAQLVIQDVLTIDGRQFRGKVDLIVASPPCQEFSYMSMPWTRAKQIAQALKGREAFPTAYTGSRTRAELTRLFEAALRIGREAECPVVIENVRGAQPWVGRAKANYGSFYLFGDVPSVPLWGDPFPAPSASDANKGFKDFSDCAFAQFGSKSSARKAAIARIAKIPERLSRWIARYYYPDKPASPSSGGRSPNVADSAIPSAHPSQNTEDSHVDERISGA